MTRFTRNGILLAALILPAAAPAAFASTIDYLNLTADSTDINGAAGYLGYTSNSGPSVNVVGTGTTYSAPTAAGLTDATLQTTTVQFDQLANANLSSSALATGNLAAGTVGVSAIPQAVPAGKGYNSSESIADATLSDLLTFDVAGANSSTITDIGVTFTVDGDVSPGTQAADGGVVLNYDFKLGDGYIGYVYDTADNPSSFIPEEGGWVSGSILSESPGSFIFSGVYALKGAIDAESIQMALGLTCTGDAFCDVSHTGAIAFDLPSNVTFTSQSGVFLTAPTASTPEPSYALLVFAGLIATGVLARRKQRRREASL